MGSASASNAERAPVADNATSTKVVDAPAGAEGGVATALVSSGITCSLRFGGVP